MTLSPIWRTRLFTAGAAVVAVCAGVAVANGRLFWPLTLAAGVALFVVAQWQSRPLTTVLLCAVVFGYIVGNRGFAQFMPIPGFPLLPAEAVLLLGGTLLVIQLAWRHQLPIRRDALNILLLTWIGLGAARIGFDYRTYGFVAIRDFATVYYALFFYLGQEMAGDPSGRKYLEIVILAASTLLLPLFFLYDRFADFFLGVLTWRGIPLIFYKGDLAGTFMAVGSVFYFTRFEKNRRWWALAASLLLAAGVLASGNRASLLGLLVATGWLAVRGRWRFALVQATAAIFASFVILAAAAVLRIPWDRTPVFSVYERVVSVVDPAGNRTYRADDTSNKGDNNLFRMVWWRAVYDETLEINPYTGMGFGRDIADRFVRLYYPGSSEEFNVRSPHSILLTLFARMGAIGLLVFLLVMACVAARTWQAVRAGPEAAAPWLAVWVIFTSACFGVVLEGPMGAVVFWTLLGLANVSPSPAAVHDAPDQVAAAPGQECADAAISVVDER